MSDLNYFDVACCVPRVYLGQPEKNRKEIIKLIKENKKSGLIVFPELSLTGYTCGDLFFQKRLLEKAKEELLAVVDFTEQISTDISGNLLKGYSPIVIVGLPLSIDGRLYNVAAVIQSGRILGIVPKSYIPDNQEYYEKRWFASGKDLYTEVRIDRHYPTVSPNLIFRSSRDYELSLGIEICEDLWAPNPPSTFLVENGALIICNLSASSETIGKSDYRLNLISQQSARLDCAYCYAASGYGESTQDLVFGGDAVIAERGIILAQGERFKRESYSVNAQIDLDVLLHNRRLQSSYRDDRDDRDTVEFVSCKFNLSKELNRHYPKNPFVPPEESEKENRFEEILNIQAMGLGTRLEAIGPDTKMIVGISGGLDSTLALLVCARTCELFGFNPDRIIAVTMPGFGTSDQTYQNALKLIKAIGATFIEIPIVESVKLHLKDLGHSLEDKDEVYENAQARERTQILMDLANELGGIVVGTGDLSELALGWCTYNGDHMAMYGVNAGVPKTLVRYLVDHYGRHSDKELREILQDILETPVSPELLPPDASGKIAQKTEEKIGPYELHDFFLYHFIRNGFTPEKIYKLACKTFADEYSDEEILKWLKLFIRRFFTQQYKRSTLPDGPKVGSVSLSPRGDWRMPSDISYESWLDNLNFSKTDE